MEMGREKGAGGMSVFLPGAMGKCGYFLQMRTTEAARKESWWKEG